MSPEHRPPEAPPSNPSPLDVSAAASPRNRFDRMEWAGAFGDLGTLVPFIVAYISVVRMDPLGVLLAFGFSMVVCGWVYKTPIPVQPMKAIGAVATVQAVQSPVVTPEVVVAAALVTGVLWLLLGLTGWATRLARYVPPPVVRGVVLGLGMAFVLQGAQLLVTGWWVAALGGVGTLLLLRSQRFPAMLFLLAFGLVVGAWQQPERWGQLVGSGVQWQLPTWVLGRVGWGDLVVGAVLLALPQVPLTLGNAVIAIREENNRRFPQAPVTEKRLAVSTGLMNLFSASVGGVPQCHGAGGMAGHVAFGARTGGAVVILGGVLLVLGVFFSASVEHLLQLLPAAVLGIILCITGVQLALGGWAPGVPRAHHLVTGGTALVALWSVAAAFGVGLLMWQVLRRTRWVA